MSTDLFERPTLEAWLAEYSSIEREYSEMIESQGIALSSYGEYDQPSEELRGRLKQLGARFLNGGASISTGFLSSACRACVGDAGSRTFFINLRCSRNCYFCFNPNQVDYEKHCRCNTPWKDDLDDYKKECDRITHIALTGGEPLLCKEDTMAFFDYAHRENPEAHLRLYTSGTAFDEACCNDLADRGVREIRFSIKLEDGEDAVDEVLRCIAVARARIPDVMVEMPVVPGSTDRMKRLLVELDEAGVKGVNLLEFCFPLYNWAEFERRGFAVKNPPFSILYDYGYAGGLPIGGSEVACLELLVFAMEEKLNLGVHYCSLDNKNRDQILQKNRSAELDSTVYELDEGDWFYKTAKVFDGDVFPVRDFLARENCSFHLEEDGRCLAFHPSLAQEAARLGAVVALSSNVVEDRDGDLLLRELKLELGDITLLPDSPPSIIPACPRCGSAPVAN